MSAATQAPVAEARIAAPRRPPRSRSRRSRSGSSAKASLKLEPAFDLVGQLFFLKLYRLDPTFRDPLRWPCRDAGAQIHGGDEARHDLARLEDGLPPTLKLLGIRQRQLGVKIRHYA